MGTSTHNGGQKGGTPLVPSWLEQPDVNPQNENGLGPDGSQIPPVGDADRFRTPRGEFTRYINSGGRDSSLGRKSVSNYIRNSLGGSSNATQRMGAARSSSARLLKKASEAMSVAQQKKAEDRIKAAGEEVKNYSVFQDWMNDMDLKNKITDK